MNPQRAPGPTGAFTSHFDSSRSTAQPIQGDRGYDNEDGEQNTDRDAKRSRIYRACDVCRKRKIKCDWDEAASKCSHCDEYKIDCVFTPVEKKRAPPSTTKSSDGLSSRLARIERLLRANGLSEDGDLGALEKRLAQQQDAAALSPKQPIRHGGASSTSSPHNFQDPQSPEHRGSSASASVSSPFNRDPNEDNGLAEQMDSLNTNDAGDTTYIGRSSGVSIISPRGIQWVNEKTGDDSFQRMIASCFAEDPQHWRPEIFDELFVRRVLQPLPSRQECFALLRDFFDYFNRLLPLFHEPTFMHLADRHYSGEPYQGGGWWASLNIALAIAHRLRVNSSRKGEESHAWGYLKNAMAVTTELIVRNTDLLSVQALLGMSLFLQGTPNPQPSFMLSATAIRLSHSIGLHKRGSEFNLNSVEDEQRKRVFWIAYMLDKDICLRSGRPPVLDDDDMNVELPSEDPADGLGNIPLGSDIRDDGKKSMNFFRLMCIFARIQSRVYKHLYSVNASRQSDTELLKTIGELDAQLEEWKESVPMMLRPGYEIQSSTTPLIPHVLILHLAYYSCVTTIHRMCVHHGYWSSRPMSEWSIQDLDVNPRVLTSASLCVNAARKSIGLIQSFPQGDYVFIWLTHYYLVCALTTLFANILQNPHDTHARSDVKLMSLVINFFATLGRDEGTESTRYVSLMMTVCTEFVRIAKVVLDKAERNESDRGKRKAASVSEQPHSSKAAEGAPRERNMPKANRGRDVGSIKAPQQMREETQSGARRRTSADQGWSVGSRQALNTAKVSSGESDVQLHQQQGAEMNIDQLQPADTFSRVGPGPQNISPGQAGLPQEPQPLLPDGLDSANASTTFMSSDANNSSALMDSLLNDMGGSPLGSDAFGFGTTNNMGDSLTAGGTTESFQHPFIPQDLWQMPMTLEWDLANWGGFSMPGPGNVGMFDGPAGTQFTNNDGSMASGHRYEDQTRTGG